MRQVTNSSLRLYLCHALLSPSCSRLSSPSPSVSVSPLLYRCSLSSHLCLSLPSSSRYFSTTPPNASASEKESTATSSASPSSTSDSSSSSSSPSSSSSSSSSVDDGWREQSETDEASEAAEAAEAARLAEAAAQRRYTRIGAVIFLSLSSIVGYFAYRKSGFSLTDFYYMYLLAPLKQEGPNALLTHSQVEVALVAMSVSKPFLEKVASDEKLINIFVEALSMDYPQEVVLKAAMTLFVLAQDRGDSDSMQQDTPASSQEKKEKKKTGLDILATRADLVPALMNVILSPIASKDSTATCLGVMKSLAANQTLAEQMVTKEIIYGLSRAARSIQPDVSGQATEALCALVPALHAHDITKLKLNNQEANSVMNVLVNIGAMYSEQQLPFPAVLSWELALKLDPRNPNLLTMLGMEQLKLGQLDKGAITLSRSLQVDPGNLEAAFHLHRALVSEPSLSSQHPNERFQKAADALRPALTAAIQSLNQPSLPQHPNTVAMISPAFHLLCKSLERLDQLEEAVQTAQEWALQCPQDGVAHFHLGRLLLMTGKHEQALQELDVALRKDPSRPQTLLQRALALTRWSKNKNDDTHTETERENQALATLDQAERLLRLPNDAHVGAAIARARAEILERQGLLSESASQYLRAIQYLPDSATERVLAASALQKAQRQAEAYREISEAIRLWTLSAASPRFANRAAWDAARPRCRQVIDNIAPICDNRLLSESDTTVNHLCQQRDAFERVWITKAQSSLSPPPPVAMSTPATT